MGIYGRWILPRLIDWTMRAEDLAPYRGRLVRPARRRVLEVGIGSGLNLPLYGPGVEAVVGLDPSAELLRRAAPLAAHLAFPVHLVRAAAEAIPLAEGSVDTVVMAWTLCSLTDARAGLGEVRRVLRPGGELLFVEHGLAPEPGVAAWQHHLDPLWARISCHLDNPVDRMLREAGFDVIELRSGHLGKGPKPMTFMYEGRARRAAGADPWPSGTPDAGSSDPGAAP
ncbi:class I SAM-dependent methyltransferase [Roseicella aerolata]|uniref:Class I SAM-dependent methyltransferase n=1 Tax=Roseicella aerolata TaxID=2883479 RepID=A0A9X1IF95_9PROT|nr:class I SAM-dependent methyltransferase [Roseicella aerolata]MCB4823064.1 class I SAM-dependent methyltransferase [Roseicella aerolata]